MEAILTQLVFEHSMRIRINAPVSEAKKDEKLALLGTQLSLGLDRLTDRNFLQVKCIQFLMTQGAHVIYPERAVSLTQLKRAGYSMTPYGYVIFYATYRKLKLIINQNNILFGEVYDEERYRKSKHQYYLTPNSR